MDIYLNSIGVNPAMGNTLELTEHLMSNSALI